MELVSKVFPVL